MRETTDPSTATDISHRQATTHPYASPDTATDERFRVGTLVYTKRGLFLIFIWMLWGDFCFTMMERVVPQVMPLQLRKMGVCISCRC